MASPESNRGGVFGDFFSDFGSKIKESLKGAQYRMTGGRSPFFTPKVGKHKLPIENELDNNDIITTFEKYMRLIDTIEEKWDVFWKNWLKLIDIYADTDIEKNVGFYRKNEYIKDEFAAYKYGSTPSEEKVSIEVGAEDKRAKAEATGEDFEDEDDYAGDEEKLNEKQLEEFESRIYIGNVPERDNSEMVKGHMVKATYPLPRTFKVKYWHSLFNDKDDLLNEMELACFGYKMTADWNERYQQLIPQICESVKEKYLENERRLENPDEKQIENIQNHISAIQHAFTPIFTDFFIKRIEKYEHFMRNHVRDLGRIGYQIDRMEDTFYPNLPNTKDVLGIIDGDIWFKHTYTIVDQKKIADGWSYNNLIGLFKETIKLVDAIYPEKRNHEKFINNFILPIHLEMFPKFLERDPMGKFIPKLLFPKWGERQKNMNGILEKYYPPGNQKDVQPGGDIFEKLKKRFWQLNSVYKSAMVRKDKKNPQLRFIPEDIKEEDCHFWKRDHEIAPGLDENGWPLEVATKGYVFDKKEYPVGTVLLDIFNRLPDKRRVPPSFTDKLDLLHMVTFAHNQWDAIRDDVRDGRYHPGSLTITDYLMAQKRRIGEDPHAKKLKEWENIIMIGEDELEKRADQFKDKFWDDELKPENPRYYKMKIYEKDKEGKQKEKEGIRRATNLNPAFDRRAIKNPPKVMDVKWWHLGKKRYYDGATGIVNTGDDLSKEEYEDLVKRGIIGPAISTRGISMYLMEKVFAEVLDFEEAQKLLVQFAGDWWYDYGPRDFKVNGPKNPAKIDQSIIDTANASASREKRAA